MFTAVAINHIHAAVQGPIKSKQPTYVTRLDTPVYPVQQEQGGPQRNIQHVVYQLFAKSISRLRQQGFE